MYIPTGIKRKLVRFDGNCDQKGANCQDFSCRIGEQSFSQRESITLSIGKEIYEVARRASDMGAIDDKDSEGQAARCMGQVLKQSL